MAASTLRVRALWSVALTLLAGAGILFAVVHNQVERGFTALERKEMEKNLLRLDRTIQMDLDALGSRAVDYSRWDDTYDFVRSRSSAYVEANLSDTNLTAIRVDVFAIFDIRGNSIILRGRSPDGQFFTDSEPTWLESWIQLQTDKSAHISCHQKWGGSLSAANGLALLSATPTCKDGGVGAPNGFLVMGQFVTTTYLDSLRQRLGYDVHLEAPAPDGGPRQRLDLSSERLAVAYLGLDGPHEERIGRLRVDMPRDVYTHAKQTSLRLALAFLGILGSLGLGLLSFLDRRILRRLARINNNLATIAAGDQSLESLKDPLPDEIGNLSRGIVQASLLERQAKRDAEKNGEMLQSLVRILSHDLTNHLFVARTYARIELEAHPDREGLRRVAAALERQRTLIESVKGLVAARDGKIAFDLKVANLCQLIHEAVHSLAERAEDKQVRVSIECPQSLEVQVDPTLLINSVLGNLISNAIKFSPRGATVIVRAFEGEEGIIVGVMDRGIGIPRKLQEHIFSYHVPTRRRGTAGETGTGFGMPLVKTCLEGMGGQVRIARSVTLEESPTDCGTDFEIVLRRAA